MRFVYFLVLAAVIGVGFPASNILAQEGRSTQEVLDHHLAAFGDGDVDAIMSDYADHAVIITRDVVAEGQKEIRGLFESLVAEFSKPGMSFELQHQQVHDEVAYIVWTAETADNVYEFASDTFFMRDGKIAYQTLAAKTTAK